MIEYKNASFFTTYFNNHPDFKLLDVFKKSENEDEKDECIYVGTVEFVDAIYPLVLRVEIPVTFPHKHLVFRTKSLSGYPHLIHNGKVQYGDWFCLNTPFAETAEEQLNQEVSRLKEWTIRQLRKDLPPIMDDPDVIEALRAQNAYDWEIIDEVKEYSKNAHLTMFEGLSFFKNPPKLFFFNCVRTPDDRFYVIDEPSFEKLPYIIVDEEPESIDGKWDLIQFIKQYHWNDKILKYILPDIDINLEWKETKQDFVLVDENIVDEDYSLIEKELKNEESVLESLNPKSEWISTKIPSSQKKVILDIIAQKKKEINSTTYGLAAFQTMSEQHNPLFLVCNDDDDPYEKRQKRYYNQTRQHCFVLGINRSSKIQWNICYTSIARSSVKTIKYRYNTVQFEIEKLISQPLLHYPAQYISRRSYYGRGEFCPKISNKRIAMIGLGAIGSMVAESLVHSGINNLGLWDDDIVEPGNVCRSAYTIANLGESKVLALANKLKLINPFINIVNHGNWICEGAQKFQYLNGSFYGNINYNSQDEAINEIKDYDLIIDCTGSNEMLHFISYALPNTDIVSLCITNHANELLCVTNRDGNPFELRKAYLSRIEQDTKNFYAEGSGCYSPTFLATNSDIASLTNLFVRDINLNYQNGQLLHSVIYSHTQRGVLADRIKTYKLRGYDIFMNIPNEVLLDAVEMEDSDKGNLIGHLLGSISFDGRQVMITHVVEEFNAKEKLDDAFRTSQGIIDYIGDFAYSGEESATYTLESLNQMACKAQDETIAISNPVLAVRNPNGTISFFLYINQGLVPFDELED